MRASFARKDNPTTQPEAACTSRTAGQTECPTVRRRTADGERLAAGRAAPTDSRRGADPRNGSLLDADQHALSNRSAKRPMNSLLAPANCRSRRDLTFDMSGGAKGAKRPLGRPLDGGVRGHAARVLLISGAAPCGQHQPDQAKECLTARLSVTLRMHSNGCSFA